MRARSTSKERGGEEVVRRDFDSWIVVWRWGVSKVAEAAVVGDGEGERGGGGVGHAGWEGGVLDGEGDCWGGL